MAGENCLLSVSSFGELNVTALRVSHGMSIVAYAGEASSRKAKAFYPTKRTSGSFDLRLIFTNHRSYERCASWLERYGRWASDPKTNASAMRVVIPARRFDKTAVLARGVSFGDTTASFTYTMDLGFVGSRDPLRMSSPLLSSFALARSSDPALPYLYPAGSQPGGSVGGWDRVEEVYNPDGGVRFL